MRPVLLSRIAALTGGRLIQGSADPWIKDLDVDPGSGGLFICLDGSVAAIRAAWHRGAAVLAETFPARVSGPAIRVRNLVPALQRWASTSRRLLRATELVGITGSVGKTTIKEMTACALAASHPVHKTSGNRNGQIGVALTLIEAPAEARLAVLEMGISRPGEMAKLVAMAEPSIGVLGRLSPVHAANFRSFDALVAQKAKLLHAAPHPIVHAESLPLLRRPLRDAFTYGIEQKAELRADQLRVVRSRARPKQKARITGPGFSEELLLPLPGRAMVENALAAVAVALAAKTDPLRAIDALSSFEMTVPRRQAWHRRGGVLWIDDTYNAAPASVRAALELFQLAARSRAAKNPGRRIFVFGDMAELGRGASDHHRALAGAVEESCDQLFTLGNHAAALARAVDIPAESFRDAERLTARFLRFVRPGDSILFKGSRAMKLERVVEALEQRLESLGGLGG